MPHCLVAQRNLEILASVNEIPSAAACSICGRKFFIVHNSIRGDHSGMGEMFDQHQCPNVRAISIRQLVTTMVLDDCDSPITAAQRQHLGIVLLDVKCLDSVIDDLLKPMWTESAN
jgi:hypothetical protein